MRFALWTEVRGTHRSAGRRLGGSHARTQPAVSCHRSVGEEVGTKASAASRHLASHQVAGAKKDRLRRTGRATITASAADSLRQECVVSACRPTKPPRSPSNGGAEFVRRCRFKTVCRSRRGRIATRLPPGREPEELLRHARRAESASQMMQWLTLRSSKLLK
jgi:hypothetical protein